jgi:hypothetical protein
MTVEQWTENWQEKRNFLQKIRPSATALNSDPIWVDLVLNPDRRCWKPATNVLHYSTAHRSVQEALSKMLILTTDQLLKF